MYCHGISAAAAVAAEASLSVVVHFDSRALGCQELLLPKLKLVVAKALMVTLWK